MAPIQRTLAAMWGCDLHHYWPLNRTVPAIKEFDALNQALNIPSKRLMLDYESLRQFTENAAQKTDAPGHHPG